MRVMISMATGVAALGLAAQLGAQQPKKAPAPRKSEVPEREGCVTTDGRTECRYIRTSVVDSVLMKRAAIGVQLSPTGTARDTLGVFVSRVTPKGPAENAGIVEGDRIVSVNGVDLRVSAADAGDNYAAELPSRRLSREVAKLSPGSVVNLRVYSGGRIRDVQVTAGRASDLREGGVFGMLDGMPGAAVFRSMPEMGNMRMPLQQLRSMENMRIPLERMRSLPKMRIEDMEFPRMKLEDMELPKVRIESMPGLRDGRKIRIYSPRLRDGEYRTYIIGPDGELKLEPSGKAGEEGERIEKVEKMKKVEKSKAKK
jgi:hypothetical protein